MAMPPKPDKRRSTGVNPKGSAPAAAGGRRRSSLPDSRQAALLASAAFEAMEEANFIFHKYDSNKNGQIDEDELAMCLQELQVRINGRQRKTEEEVREWVRRELRRNDTDGDGQLNFDEFVEYYNSYISQNRRPFDDCYKVTAHLGKGAFASVKKVIVKQPAEGQSSEAAVKRIQKAGVNMKLMHNEVSIWSMLNHPHLVRLLDTFETPDELLLVTELMEGGDLFDRLRKMSRFTESTAQRLATQIVSAVAYIHSNGVVHCDLKPSDRGRKGPSTRAPVATRLRPLVRAPERRLSSVEAALWRPAARLGPPRVR